MNSDTASIRSFFFLLRSLVQGFRPPKKNGTVTSNKWKGISNAEPELQSRELKKQNRMLTWATSNVDIFRVGWLVVVMGFGRFEVGADIIITNVMNARTTVPLKIQGLN